MKASGLKRERSKRSDPLETSSFFLLMRAMFYVVTGQNLGGFWLMPMWNFENVFTIQYVHDLHFACLAPLFFVTPP